MKTTSSARRVKSRLAREICLLAMETVCQEFGVPQSELRADGKEARIAFARQVAIYLAHVVGQVTLTEAASTFLRDRKTVIHACRVIEDRRDAPVFDRQIAILERELRERLALTLARRAGRFSLEPADMLALRALRAAAAKR